MNSIAFWKIFFFTFSHLFDYFLIKNSYFLHLKYAYCVVVFVAPFFSFKFAFHQFIFFVFICFYVYTARQFWIWDDFRMIKKLCSFLINLNRKIGENCKFLTLRESWKYAYRLFNAQFFATPLPPRPDITYIHPIIRFLPILHSFIF